MENQIRVEISRRAETADGNWASQGKLSSHASSLRDGYRY